MGFSQPLQDFLPSFAVPIYAIKSPMIQYFIPSPAQQSPTQWNWISLTGPDSTDFLHRLTTVNVRNLDEGQGAPGCFLSSLGKIRVYFHLWKEDPQSFGFELDGGSSGKWKNDLLAVIDQYTFGEKISITDPAETLGWAWLFLDRPEDILNLGLNSLQERQTSVLPEGIRICHHGTADYGKIWLSLWGAPSALQSWMESRLGKTGEKAQPLSFETLEEWRIQSLGPRVDAEVTDAVLPLEIGLHRAIAENKGCYPGQEVIERIIALGSPPRRLVRIEGKGTPPSVGTAILNFANPIVEIGQITSVAPTHRPTSSLETSFLALGWVKKIYAKKGLEVQFAGTLNSKGEINEISSQ